MSRFPHGAYLPNGLKTDPPLPPDAPTIGYMLNHLCLRIRDPAKSLHFYIDLMGMRTIFVTNTGPMTVYFLGYPRTDRHRENLEEFGRETVAHTPGLLELFHVHGAEKQAEGLYGSGNEPPYLGFCHLGFSVPDLPKAVERLKAEGVPVIKNLGEAEREKLPISDWENERGMGVEVEGTESELHPDFKKIFGHFVYLQDPDGYWVELIPQGFTG
ncbi:MAG: hypothetical protein Q9227_004264 [Pyrenula ochraceoflavens]